MCWDLLFAVFAGGMAGTALRYALSTFPSYGAFRFGTLAANLAAAFCFAGLTSYLSHAPWLPPTVSERANRGLGTGMCGGLSTMSTLAAEGFASLSEGDTTGAAAYLLCTFACGLAAATAGSLAGRRLASGRSANHRADGEGRRP